MPVALAHNVIEGPEDSDTVILLGSLGSDRSMWNPQIAALATVATVIPVDVRGHGGSPTPAGPYTISELGNDVTALLDTLGVLRPHVVGLSLGGAIAQWLAIHRPQRVATLTLLCTAAQFGDPAKWTARAAAVRRDGLSSIADSIVARWFTPELAQREPDVVRRALRMIDRVTDEGYAACCEALAQWDSHPDLAFITAPTLIVAGEQDSATPPVVMSRLVTGIPGAKVEVLSPAAHVANIEQSEAVSRLLVDHICVKPTAG